MQKTKDNVLDYESMAESDAELKAWLERYEPVEREIMLAC